MFRAENKTQIFNNADTALIEYSKGKLACVDGNQAEDITCTHAMCQQDVTCHYICMQCGSDMHVGDYLLLR